MSCIKPDDVRKILPDGVVLDDDALEMAITSAGCMQDDILACNPGISSTCMAQIQIYLAAHFASVSDYSMSIKSEKDGCADASATYGFEFGEGVLGTPFGIQANLLSRGCLAQMDKQPTNLLSIGCL